MKRFSVSASFTMYADDEAEAQRIAASCVELWSEQTGIGHVDGIGLARGYVTVHETTAERPLTADAPGESAGRQSMEAEPKEQHGAVGGGEAC